MNTKNNNIPIIFVKNPFNLLDKESALSIINSGGYPIIKVDKVSNNEIEQFSKEINSKFGIAINDITRLGSSLPDNIEYIISPINKKTPISDSKKIIYQVTSLEQALEAQNRDAFGIIAKGNESGGCIGEDSSFILFQKIIKNINIPVWLQGGIGLHTSAALITMGASGIVLDYQLSFFPELRLNGNIKAILKHLDGSETTVIHSHRFILRPGSEKIDENIIYEEFRDIYNTLKDEATLIPVGQDIGNSLFYYHKYKNLKNFFFAIYESIAGHTKQAKYFEPIKPNNALAKELNIQYPIAQGPMARITDVPEFAKSVAEAGGLPFLALSVSNREDTERLLSRTNSIIKNKTWGVGILGFIDGEILNQQLKLIDKIHPPVVLIAGGRPSQAKPLEKAGIKVFLHVPSTSLLDSFLKEGAKRFIFEGRECGGHVGPLSSFVLWEKQINRLLQEEDLSDINVFFAGGILNDLSSSLISVMSAPLVARGAKVGVLLGTSYLFTKEAVETGAILEQFQQEAIKNNETILLESSPGHVVRCLNTPYVNYFTQLKREIANKTVSSKERGKLLEELNIGRLRIAAKGLVREGDKIIQIEPNEQINQGLYMIGQVATCMSSILSIKELHENIAPVYNKLIQQAKVLDKRNFQSKTNDIAVIGMACIFPEAKNLDEYWKNIIEARDSITEVSEDRWKKDLHYSGDAKNGVKSCSKWGGFIPDIDFDPIEFGIPPQSLASIEPVQLLSLKVAKEALKNAGYDKKEFDRENTAVIFGVENGSELAFGYELRNHLLQYFEDIPSELEDSLPHLTEDSFAGILSNVVSGRIANRLNLGGKNFTVDAACGSSLAALDSACQELITYKANMALAGAADLHNDLTDYLKFASVQALTSEGHCKTFDQDADGISIGEGIGVLVLKRLEDAMLDGDKIYGVIKSVGASSDGRSLGLTAPNKKGQIKAFERAYFDAKISPSEVGLIEAHGTGTVVGDKTELSSMTELILHAGSLPGQIHLGSVKTQIGHTKCTAGMAGLIKALLSVYHGIFPPTLHLNNPNEYYNDSLSPFIFKDKSTPWLNEKRIAGISAFGFGGTNFHAIIENLNAQTANSITLKQWPAELFIFRANNDDELKHLLSLISKILRTNTEINIKDLAYTLANQNQKQIRLTIVAKNLNDLLAKIDSFTRNKLLPGVYVVKKTEGKIAFLFSGQGSQRINMVRELFVMFPQIRSILSANPKYAKILFPNKVFTQEQIEKQKEEIKDTRNAQPLLGIVDYALAKFLVSLDILPDMLAGHSYGEIPALCFSGVIEEKDLVNISKDRAQCILDAIQNDPGAMVAVNCSDIEINELLKDEDGISMANHNSPLQRVLSGTVTDIDRFCSKLKALKISFKKLEVACAFHSPVIAKSQIDFKEKLKGYCFDKQQIPVWSNTTANVYPSDKEEIKERLSEHLVKPVRFCEEIQNMYTNGVRIFIEVGPGNVLTNLTNSIITEDVIALNTEQNTSEGGVYKLLDTLAQYISCGKEINMQKLFIDRDAEIIDLEDFNKYPPSKTLWKINGGIAVPANGVLPTHGFQPIKKPLNINQINSYGEMKHSLETDKIIMEYLENLRAMIKTQSDVMMGYLGNPYNNQVSKVEFPDAKTSNGFNNYEGIPQNRMKPKQEKGSIQPSLSDIDLKMVLLETISEKTGYPIDMLNMDMDLEADLSIDSIKRIEIINVLKEKLKDHFSNQFHEEGVVEKLASIKTLNGLEEWISNSMKFDKKLDLSAVNNHNNEDIENYKGLSLKEALLSSISEKTGYPIDMLDMNMDMEADLSIDSIKRIEVINDLKKKIGGFHFANFNEDQALEKLASIKTLNGLIDWIVLSSDKSGEKQYELIQDQPSVFITDVNQNILTLAQITEILLDAISEKTGYPKEMLEMGMDMEADLSIDSIKRVEIINVVKTKVEIHAGNEIEANDIVEKLASIKTLQGLTEWIYNSIKNNTSNISATKVEINNTQTKGSINDNEMFRLVVEIVRSRAKKENSNLKGKKIAITDDGGIVSTKLKALLEYEYANADIINETNSLNSYDGLIVLDVFDATKQPDVNSFFSYIQKLNQSRVKWIFAITDINRRFKEYNHFDICEIRGYSGFLKSLGKEWQATCRTINIDDSESMKDVASIIVDEFSYSDNCTETYYRKGERYKAEIQNRQLNKTKHIVPIEKDSVVLVFGGAQGITSEILKDLSSEMPCNYILVGRSPLPSSIDYDIVCTETEDIRKELLHKGKFKSPKELELKVQQVYKRNQILSTIDALEKNGSKVHYYPIDVTNENALVQLLEDLYKKHDRIDGIIHAAGYLEDKHFQNKDLDSFMRVFSTKVVPLKVLSTHLRKDTKFCFLFSSIASVMGNKGQVDYAAANSVLDQASHILNRKINGRVVAINWGPWKGKGMNHEGLEKEFLKRGVSSIPLPLGVKAFIDELKYGDETQVILMTRIEELTPVIAQ
jgi:acyl transferase domain-containing protein/NAD(P)H-dependent flavin oxidoreductase YrpB (nitropropane dioxygenase family)/NAD(P)-dependent dehydrogenase (short-subunit alcohol dehydrogenase family)/acyl carrier protein